MCRLVAAVLVVCTFAAAPAGAATVGVYDGPEITAVVDGGFMHVTSDGDATRVDVLAANAQMREEIDVDDARRRVSELEDRLRERDTADAEADLAGVKESLLKAQARINLAG